MLIPFADIAAKHKGQIRGIIHIGANTGQELDAYIEAGIKNVVFIEPIPEVFKQLEKNVLARTAEQVSGVRCIKELVSDKDGQLVDFFITDSNNGESSSYLPMKEHLKMHPDVKVTRKLKMETIKFDTLCDFYKIDLKEYNFLNMDIQGAEFFAMLGMKKSMPSFDFIYLEVNEKEIYENNVLLPKMNAYLEMTGFSQKELNMTPNGWGDAFYVRNVVTPRSPEHLPKGEGPAHQQTKPLDPSPLNLEPASNSARAAKELTDVLNNLKYQLSREVSGSVAENMIKSIEGPLKSIINKYVKD